MAKTPDACWSDLRIGVGPSMDRGTGPRWARGAGAAAVGFDFALPSVGAERIGLVVASQQSLRAAVFLALSVDGCTARPDGDLEWLTSRGTAAGDAGFTPFVE